MKILNRKAWWNYEKKKYLKKLQTKEESLKLHIEEMDELRKENHAMKEKIRLLEEKLNTIDAKLHLGINADLNRPRASHDLNRMNRKI